MYFLLSKEYSFIDATLDTLHVNLGSVPLVDWRFLYKKWRFTLQSSQRDVSKSRSSLQHGNSHINASLFNLYLYYFAMYVLRHLTFSVLLISSMLFKTSSLPCSFFKVWADCGTFWQINTNIQPHSVTHIVNKRYIFRCRFSGSIF